MISQAELKSEEERADRKRREKSYFDNQLRTIEQMVARLREKQTKSSCEQADVLIRELDRIANRLRKQPELQSEWKEIYEPLLNEAQSLTVIF